MDTWCIEGARLVEGGRRTYCPPHLMFTFQISGLLFFLFFFFFCEKILTEPFLTMHIFTHFAPTAKGHTHYALHKKTKGQYAGLMSKD